ncbi:MAG: M23 family metallopeptidase [Acidobacteria bacterium]|nr:M23 family metallopeptidase [Acidobacteriota bacterium]
MRKLAVVFVVLLLVAGGAFVYAGRLPGPAIEITSPGAFVGRSTPLDVVIDAPGSTVSSVDVAFEQNGVSTPLLSRAAGQVDGHVTDDGPGRVRVTHLVGRENVSGIVSGPARLVVTASRPVLFGLRQATSTAARDVTVRLDPPSVAVLSTHHYINQGGAELVVYRVSPADVASGVRVGDLEYPGFPAAGVEADGVSIADPAVRVAFFAVLHDQPVDTPIQLFARDEAGNSATAPFETRVFPKPFKESRIPLDDRLIDRVVPAILAGTSDVAPEGSNIEKYLVINGELRRRNAETIASFASKTSPEMLFQGVVFHPFTNTAVQSAFADRRTYVYQGKEVDRQTHLGFDLASFAMAPVPAANAGTVLMARELGIYGNCVIIDHGLGVQSLYAHLSSFSVQEGASVEKGQEVGKSGITGLAGGDHLHFTMLVNGRMVNPIEWWDPKWFEDRVLRKLREASK